MLEQLVELEVALKSSHEPQGGDQDIFLHRTPFRMWLLPGPALSAGASPHWSVFH